MVTLGEVCNFSHSYDFEGSALEPAYGSKYAPNELYMCNAQAGRRALYSQEMCTPGYKSRHPDTMGI